MAKNNLTKVNEVRKCRIYPNPEQAKFIDACFGACRFVWNYAVGIITFHQHLLDIKKFLNPEEGKKVYYPKLLKRLEELKEKSDQTLLNKHLLYMKKCLNLDDKQFDLLKNKNISMKKYETIVEGNFKKYLKERCHLDNEVIEEIFEQKGLNYTLLLRDKCFGKLKTLAGYEWLREPYSGCLNDVIYNDLKSAIKKMYSKIGGFPKFKNRDSKKSFQNQAGSSNKIVHTNTKYSLLSVPKLKDIKMVFHQEISPEAELRTVTISKNAAGEYYASCLFQSLRPEIQKKKVTPKTVLGIDRGITDLMIDSNGQRFLNPKNMNDHQARIAILQKRLQKKRDLNPDWKESKRYQKFKLKVARKIESVNKLNNDYKHKATAKIINDKSVNMVVLEDLNISGMLKNKKLSKHISRCGWYEIERQLTYKSEKSGKQLIKVGRNFPSSQLCSSCGFRNKSLKLSDRSWKCPDCGVVHDRDVNAALNLKKEGIKQLKKT